MSERAYNKAQRLSRLAYFLYRNPYGLSVSELARVCNVHKRTIQRDLRDLEEIGVPLWEDEGDPPRYGIIKGYYLPPVHLSLCDALALYLAGRLLARQAGGYNPLIAEALAKLAAILPESIAAHMHATIREMTLHREDRHLVEVLEVLALGWATGRVVRLRYRAAGSENVHGYHLKPYFLDACGDYRGAYVIGWADYFDAIHTFRVNRILEAELTNETFEIPSDFEGPALLRNAWGIMFGETCQEVVLRFAPSVSQRVHETLWHPSQVLTDEPDGGCTLRIQVAHPEEMLYWIRGWGPQVEVLAPDWLRAQIAAEAAEMAALYDRSPSHG